MVKPLPFDCEWAGIRTTDGVRRGVGLASSREGYLVDRGPTGCRMVSEFTGNH